MAHFTLTLPVDSNGSTQGGLARVVSGAQLSPTSNPSLGYRSEYFDLVHDSVWGVKFWCPLAGAVSSATSDSPRTELRHQLALGVNDGWDPFDPIGHKLRFLARIERVPRSNGTIIVAQVHGHRLTTTDGTINAAPLMLLYLEPDPASHGSYRIRAKTRPNPDPRQSATYMSDIIRDSVHLGDQIEIEVAVAKSTWNINGKTRAIPTAWAGVNVYFKCGVYLDDRNMAASPDDGGAITMYALQVD